MLPGHAVAVQLLGIPGDEPLAAIEGSGDGVKARLPCLAEQQFLAAAERQRSEGIALVPGQEMGCFTAQQPVGGFGRGRDQPQGGGGFRLRSRFTGGFQLGEGRDLHPLHQAEQLQLGHQPGAAGGVPGAGDIVVQLRVNGGIAVDLRQGQAQAAGLCTGFQLLSYTGLDSGVLQAGVDLVHRVEPADQRQGGLFTDAGHTGDIVRAVAHQCLDLDQFPGGDTVLFPDLLHAIEGALRAAHFGGGQPHGGGIAHQLQAVPVTGGDDALVAGVFAQAGQGAQNIVGLVPLTGHHRVAQLVQQLLEVGQLHGQFVRHTVAAGLVPGVELVPEGGAFEVKGKGDRIGSGLLADPKQDGEEPVDAVGVDSILGGKRTHTVVGPVENTVGIDGKQLHTCKILSRNGIITCTPAGLGRGGQIKTEQGSTASGVAIPGYPGGALQEKQAILMRLL